MRFHSKWFRFLAVAVIILSSLSCTLSLINPNPGGSNVTPTAANGAEVTATPALMAEVTFSVSIPVPLNAGEKLAIGFLDEVTGLGLNTTYYEMNPVDALHFDITLPLGLHSVVKYRYYRQGAISINEISALGYAVRYRIYDVDGPGNTNDIVASWSDGRYSGSYGKISGTVLEAGNGQNPIPNILVSAGGVSTLTDSDGQFNLDGLPEGTQLLTAYALDGAYSTFQQGATVANGLVTRSQIVLKSAATVNVTFNVTLPGDSVAGAPVRLAGNLYQLGNTFADLNSGLSTLASRMPILKTLPDGRQSITLALPVGADIRYKYTLGDGFWNAEHGADENFVLRQVIVPDHDLNLNDTVLTWQAGNKAGPIVFDATVPVTTPAGDTISIQFKTFDWAEALPMWSMGNNRWVYKLYSPLNMLGSFQYRYCRNDQCGSTDDLQTTGNLAQGRSISTSLVEQNIQDSITAWTWWPGSEPGNLVANQVNQRPASFWAGVEFSGNYSAEWQAWIPNALQNIHDLGSNFVVLQPTWTASSSAPLVFAPTPGSDPLWIDLSQTVRDGIARNLTVALYATPKLLPSDVDFWMNAPRTPEWWDAWFERYHAFAIYHADLAARSGAQALILGGNAILPSLPGGTLADGTPSNVPADAGERWRAIIKDVRGHFPGLLLWAYPYNGTNMQPAPVFIDEFYGFYLLWSAPLSPDSSTDVASMTAKALELLDNDIAPLLLSVGKGAVIGISYPSAEGAAAGCIPTDTGGCFDGSALARPLQDIEAVKLDLQGQANIYQAMLEAVNQRDWVGGFVSRGYYPPAVLMDKSDSIHGKMASDELWYWFPRMLGLKQ